MLSMLDAQGSMSTYVANTCCLPLNPAILINPTPPPIPLGHICEGMQGQGARARMHVRMHASTMAFTEYVCCLIILFIEPGLTDTIHASLWQCLHHRLDIMAINHMMTYSVSSSQRVHSMGRTQHAVCKDLHSFDVLPPSPISWKVCI